MIILEIVKLLVSIFLGVFSKDGWRNIFNNWRRVATLLGVAFAVLALLYVWNPFDDADKKQARADAKAERIASAQCKAELARMSEANKSLALAANEAAQAAEKKAKIDGRRELDEMKHQHALQLEAIERQAATKPLTGGLSPQTLKEMAR